MSYNPARSNLDFFLLEALDRVAFLYRSIRNRRQKQGRTNQDKQ